MVMSMNSLNGSYNVWLYRDSYDTGRDEYEEGVEPCEDVPVLEEDGGEVVEDDPGAEDAEDATEDG